MSMFVNDLVVGRRAALGALAAMGAAVAVPCGAASATAGPRLLDLNDPYDALYAFGKIWAGYDAPAVGAFHGLMYARLPGQRLLPLFGYAGVGVAQARIEPDGSLSMKSRESGYFTDLETGDILETWRNPFTDETVEVYHFYNDLVGGTLGPTFSKYVLDNGATTRMNQGSVFPDAHGVAPFRMPWQDFGDDVMMTWDYAHRQPNPVAPAGWPKASTGAIITPSEHYTFVVSREQLQDRGLASVRVRTGFSRLSEAWPFMRLGGTPYAGLTLFGRMHSHKGLNGLGDVPPKVRAYMEKYAPAFLTLPDVWPSTNKRLDTWSSYAMDVPPENPAYPWRWAKEPRPALSAYPPTGLGARSWADRARS